MMCRRSVGIRGNATTRSRARASDGSGKLSTYYHYRSTNTVPLIERELLSPHALLYVVPNPGQIQAGLAMLRGWSSVLQSKPRYNPTHVTIQSALQSNPRYNPTHIVTQTPSIVSSAPPTHATKHPHLLFSSPLSAPPHPHQHAQTPPSQSPPPAPFPPLLSPPPSRFSSRFSPPP